MIGSETLFMTENLLNLKTISYTWPATIQAI